MYLYITLKPVGEMKIPLTYNHLVQSMIYHTIDPELADFLHDQGYESGTRKFKLFSFSRLSGRFLIDASQGMISFDGGVRLVISSPINRFIQSIANGLLSSENLILGNSRLKAEGIDVQQYTVDREKIVVKTLSPIVAYSTFLRPDGRKYTCYFQPGDSDYNQLICNNLCEKYQALYGQELKGKRFEIKVLGQVKQHVINYKDIVIKGYSGKLELSGSKELLQMALDAGLGSKNSQGFGCIIPY